MVSEAKLRELKIKLLNALRESPLTEEQIVRNLGINRALSRRLIALLKDEGFYILETNRGYELKLDKINYHDLSNRLRTRILGKRIIFLREVDSTMTVAKTQWAHEGLVVLAEKQLKGRGRRGKTWFSPGGGLWFSVVLRPKNHPRYTPLIGLFSSLAVSDAILEVTGLESKLKWPNDITIRGKKVCCILTEAIYEIGEISSAIVGVRLNNNIPKEVFPEELRETATSLMEEAGAPIPPLVMLCKILEKLEFYYSRFLRKAYRNIVELWKERQDLLGCKVVVQATRGRIVGVAEDIDECGRLVIRTEAGDKIALTMGVIEKVYKEPQEVKVVSPL